MDLSQVSQLETLIPHHFWINFFNYFTFCSKKVLIVPANAKSSKVDYIRQLSSKLNLIKDSYSP